MRKFITGLFFSLVFIVVLIMLFSVPKNSFFRDNAGAYWSGGSTITFDDIDYSVNLPYDTSLDDINNSWLNDTTLRSATFSPSSGVFYDIDYHDFSGFNISWSQNSYANLEIFTSSVPFIPTYDRVYVYYPTSLLSSLRQIYFYGTNNGVTKYAQTYVVYSNDDVTCRMYYNLDTSFTYQYIGFQFLAEGGTIDLDFIGYSYTYYDNFYSSAYVNELLNTKGIYNNNYSWSTSPVMSVNYYFSAFTPDTTLYYIKNIPIFNISKTLPNYLSELSSRTTFTEDVLTRLKNAYTSLQSSPPNVSKLDLSSRFNNTLISAIGEIVKSIARILFYSAEVATYSGLLVFTPVLDMFAYLSIILYSSFNSWFTL